MIRTFIKPTQSKLNIQLDLPLDYLGEELELIVFKKKEGLVTEKPETSMSDFWDTISDETAQKMHKNIAKMHKEWTSDI